jgi:DNA replication protein DnaC
MLLHGPKGSGKTTEAGRAALEFAEGTERAARFVDFADLLMRVRESYGQGSTKTELSILQPLREAAFLVVDDVAASKVSQHGADVLYAILNFRYERGLRTVITSNYSPSEIAARLAPTDDVVVAERIADRIIEMALIVKLDSPSYRRDQGKRTDRDWSWAEKDSVARRFAPVSFAEFKA